MLRITLSVPEDLAGLGARWRTLEAAADGSFFQSWSWVGCLAAARFSTPVLLAAEVRRAMRRHEAAGKLALRPAATVGEALGFLDELERLHQAGWVRRGRPGAFAVPFFGRFHRALITEAWPRGEVELLHIVSGSETLG